MSELLRPQCSQCIFWVADDPVTVGHCHRHPPQVYYNAKGNVAAQKIPLVDHHHWCGEWSDNDDLLKDAAARSLKRAAGNREKT